MEPTKRESMLSRIRVIEFGIDTIECQRKLNQFKPDVDHVAVVKALLAKGDAADVRLARKMQALRPQLDYDL
jgi:transcriptional regulator